MSNTTGERTFSTTDRNIVAPKFPQVPAGNHTGDLGGDATVAKSDRWDAVPYVKSSFTADGTAQAEGGKDLRVFHMFFLGLVPGGDGVANVDRPDGITAAAKAMGTAMEGVEIITREVENPETGEKKTLEYLNPKQVVEFLNNMKGTKVSYRVKIEAGTKGYEDKAKIAKFLLPDNN